MDIRMTRLADAIFRAWTRPEYRERLKSDPSAALGELGIELTEGIEVETVEDRDNLVHVVLPAAPWVLPSHLSLFPFIGEDGASDYQRTTAAINARVWIDEEFKQRLMADPVQVLAEQGVALDAGMDVKVLQNTARKNYLAIPLPPESEDLSDEELRKHASGCVVGVPYENLY